MDNHQKKKTNSWVKSGIKPKDIDPDYFKEICNNSQSMAEACSILGLHFTTFKKYAILYECYKTNQPGKGMIKLIHPRITSVENYKSRGSAKKFVIKHKLVPYICSECGITDNYNNKLIVLHLDHINGDGWDHRLENLRFLCPNCHSQTETYAGKNKKIKEYLSKPKTEKIIKVKSNKTREKRDFEKQRKQDNINKRNHNRQYIIDLIESECIDFNQWGWGVELSKLNRKITSVLS